MSETLAELTAEIRIAWASDTGPAHSYIETLCTVIDDLDLCYRMAMQERECEEEYWDNIYHVLQNVNEGPSDE